MSLISDNFSMIRYTLRTYVLFFKKNIFSKLIVFIHINQIIETIKCYKIKTYTEREKLHRIALKALEVWRTIYTYIVIKAFDKFLRYYWFCSCWQHIPLKISKMSNGNLCLIGNTVVTQYVKVCTWKQ